MTGIGVSYGAVSVMNAIPCGIGSTIGIDLKTEAVFDISDKTEIVLVGRPEVRDSLARTCVKRTLEWIGKEPVQYKLTSRSPLRGDSRAPARYATPSYPLCWTTSEW